MWVKLIFFCYFFFQFVAFCEVKIKVFKFFFITYELYESEWFKNANFFQKKIQLEVGAIAVTNMPLTLIGMRQGKFTSL